MSAYDVKSILAGKRRSLAKAITLTESLRQQDRLAAQGLLEQLLPHAGQSLRIGITGTPGVGKSTFIEALGNCLVEKGKHVAVLAVDPSSPVAGGSILGDKTRMETLSRQKNAYIRPSPSSGQLGGVAQKTRESIVLCEAAGFDVVLIETVGVGQSEVEVAGMVDFFLVLLQPNSGDDIQGIKKGIIELADALVINKADGDLQFYAEQTQQLYQKALGLLSEKSFWKTPVLTCSAIDNTGVAKVWSCLCDYDRKAVESGEKNKKRAGQNLAWMEKLFYDSIKQKLDADSEFQEKKKDLAQKVAAGTLTPLLASEILTTRLSESKLTEHVSEYCMQSASA